MKHAPLPGKDFNQLFFTFLEGEVESTKKLMMPRGKSLSTYLQTTRKSSRERKPTKIFTPTKTESSIPKERKASDPFAHVEDVIQGLETEPLKITAKEDNLPSNSNCKFY